MTPISCIPAEEIADALALGADHPRRQHLEECPRCRALAASYRDFMQAVPASDVEAQAAGRQLSRALRAEIGAPPVAPAEAPRRVLTRERRAWWTLPALRPVWGLASLVVVVGVSFAILQMGRRAPPEPILRGDDSAAVLRLGGSRALPGGGVELRWSPVPGADRYEVRLFDADLAERARLDAGADTVRVLGVTELPAQGAAGELVLWRVAAMRGGREVALSAVGSFER